MNEGGLVSFITFLIDPYSFLLIPLIPSTLNLITLTPWNSLENG